MAKENLKERLFEFSVRAGTPEDLIDWMTHFMKKKIPAGIVYRGRGTSFSVWRKGVEAGHKGKSRITPDMKVHSSVHGFETLFEEERRARA